MMEIHSNINITVEMEATDSLVMGGLLLEQLQHIQLAKLPQLNFGLIGKIFFLIK